MFRYTTRVAVCGALVLALVAHPHTAAGQGQSALDSLVAHALIVNPGLRAAEAQSQAARARIAPAGAWADPILVAGLQNQPVSRATPGSAASGSEPMTMKMLGVVQTIPYPGKTSLRSAVARAEADAAEARLAAARREVRQEIHRAYFDVVAARMILVLVEQQQQVASGILPATQARYVSGTAAQSDLLKARAQAGLLVQERNAATNDERKALAELNAILDQPADAPIAATSFPRGELTSQPTGSLDSLQMFALHSNPRLQERRALIAAQTAQTGLAKRAHLPDVDVSLQYGQRDGLPDMISAMISVPLPVQRGRKQSAEARASGLDVAAAEADLRAEESALRSEIARSYATVERHRADVSLLGGAILPQARATFASASGAYQSGRGELLGVLDAMRSLFATETMYVRSLSELAKSTAELDALVGEGVMR